jgi:hypothetical protein
MGYTTDFEGHFTVTPALTPEHALYLQHFGQSRRMKRDPKKAEKLNDPVRLAVGLPIGVEGGYFVGNAETDSGQVHDDSIIEYNLPPKDQPGLWCQWEPNRNDPTVIEWDGTEKFYDYTEWLKYLIDNFLKRWEYKLNGEVTWQGENSGDMGIIRVDDNVIEVGEGEVVYNFNVNLSL